MDAERVLTHSERLSRVLILIKLSKYEKYQERSLEDVFSEDLFSEQERDYLLFNINNLESAAEDIIFWTKNNKTFFKINLD